MTANSDRLVDPEEPQQQKQSTCEKFAVAIVFTIFVLFRAADRVFLKRVQNALTRSSYNLVWGNILWPLAIQIMQLFLIAGYIIYMRSTGDKTYDLKFFSPSNPKASSIGRVPLYLMALFSLGDQLNAAISSPASPFVSLPVQSLMTNMIIIWMAMLAFVWIRTRFKQVHYVGMALVLLSIAVQLSKKVTDFDCSPDGVQNGLCPKAYKSNTGEWIQISVGAMSLWYAVFFVSTLPSAAGNVFKQKILQHRDVDVWYATWWSGMFQVMWGWLCIPLMWIKMPGQDSLSPGETFTEIGYTLGCLAGHNNRPGDEACAVSPGPWVWVIFYLSFNVTFNIALLYLTKRLSAVWAQVGTVVCLNLVNIFSQSRLLMGDGATHLSLDDWLGTILASVALWVYNIESEIRPDGGKVAEQTAGSFVADGPAADIIQRTAGGEAQGGSFVKLS